MVVTAPRFITIADGLVAQVIERQTPLPRRLEQLVADLAIVSRTDVPIRTTRRSCTDAEHAWALWMRGVYAALDLQLRVCPWCATVEVRDISIDLLPGVMGRGKPRRKDDVLGWYSGRRPAGRTYL